MAPLAVVIALDPVGQVPLELLRADQLLAVVVEHLFQLEHGDEALYGRGVPVTWAPEIGPG